VYRIPVGRKVQKNSDFTIVPYFFSINDMAHGFPFLLNGKKTKKSACRSVKKTIVMFLTQIDYI